ncbi:MAG: hypothetical protein RR631_09555, partial [Erysipelothrix sp.]
KETVMKINYANVTLRDIREIIEVMRNNCNEIDYVMDSDDELNEFLLNLKEKSLSYIIYI